MTDPGRALRTIQYRGHLALDTIYAGLAEAVEAAVLGQAVTRQDRQVLTPLGATLAGLAIGEALGRAEPVIVARIAVSGFAAERAADPQAVEPVLAGVASQNGAAVSLAGNRPTVLRQVTALLQRGVALGAEASEVARLVRQYFSPWFAVRRDPAGRLVRDGRLGAVRHWPGRAGMASAHARLVMLDATTAAHGRGMRRLASREGLGLHWNVSVQHGERDVCDLRARTNIGYGPGNYPSDDAPEIPTHPRCRCYYSTVELKA